METKSGAIKEKSVVLGDEAGVVVNEVVGGFSVAFGFDRTLARMMDRVPNAEFDKAFKTYLVPQASEKALASVIDEMRAMSKEVEIAHEAIVVLATVSGMQEQANNSVGNNIKPQVTGYHKAGKFYAGEVKNVNEHFSAQFTGHGIDDGAAFMVIHRLGDLDSRLEVGDRVGIVYDEQLRGVVSELSKNKSPATLVAEYHSNQGVEIDGVTVSDRGDKIGISFAINPAMVERIRRVEGASFNKADKVWEVPKEKEEFALFAAQDLRAEFVLDAKEVASLKQLAEKSVENAKVWNAFTKDGTERFGKVLGVSQRYALQKTGREDFTLHHLSALSSVPIVGHDTSVTYNKGVGAVVDLDLKRAQNLVMAAGR